MNIISFKYNFLSWKGLYYEDLKKRLFEFSHHASPVNLRKDVGEVLVDVWAFLIKRFKLLLEFFEDLVYDSF